MNNCVFTGRLTKDPEIKTTQNGKKYINFSIAVDRKTKDSNGQRQADFIPCIAWNKTAEIIAQYFVKGSPIGVIGSLQVRSYDKDGEKRFAYEILVNEIDFIGGAKSPNNPEANQGNPEANQDPQVEEVIEDKAEAPQELPFEI